MIPDCREGFGEDMVHGDNSSEGMGKYGVITTIILLAFPGQIGRGGDHGINSVSFGDA